MKNFRLSLLLVFIFGFSSSSFAQSNDKEKHFLFDLPLFDLPDPNISLSQTRTTVSTQRISNGNVNLGTAISPFSEQLKYVYYLAPELTLRSKDFRITARGGIGEALVNNKIIYDRYLDIKGEGSVWLLVFGVGGFVDQEKAPGAIKGLKYNADFFRNSYGANSWAGIKLGDFTKNFITFKVGRGYIRTKGSEKFEIESVDTGYIDLYLENFRISSAYLEAGLIQRRFGENIKATGNLYQRVVNSPDPLRYGLNEFREYKLEGSLEFVPFLRLDFFRILLRGSKIFGDRDSLMFASEAVDFGRLSGSKAPNLQFILRFAF